MPILSFWIERKENLIKRKMEEIANVQNSMPDNFLIDDTCRIIESARDYAYRAVNTALTIRNWKLGERISREHLDDNGRAEYGKQVIATLATILPEILDAMGPKSGNVDFVPRADTRRGWCGSQMV